MTIVRLTLIHPCIGRRRGQHYIRSWQMEPLPPATIAGLTPPDVDVRFYDDRMEEIPFDEPADLVAISVETYTARRSYQIASEYRRRRVPVVMGGFHRDPVPGRGRAVRGGVVVGEAEGIWPRLIDDFRHGRLEPMYRAEGRPSLAQAAPDRRIFRGKRYLPIGLVEAGRGCHFKCDFCAVQTMFSSTQTRRPIDEIVAEIARDPATAEAVLLRRRQHHVEPRRRPRSSSARSRRSSVRWVSQASINAAHDEEFLDLLVRSGCQGVLIGFESLDPANLAAMNKSFNTMRGGYEVALANLRRHRTAALRHVHLRLRRATRRESFARAVDFAQRARASTSRRSTTSRRFPARRSTRGWTRRAGCSTTPGGSTSATATTWCRSAGAR